VQPQTPLRDWQADIDSRDDHDETPPNTLSTWLLGLLFVLVISWLPAATDTVPTPTGAVQVVDHHHLTPTPGFSACMAPGQEVNPLAWSCRGNGRPTVSGMPIYLPSETP